MPIQHNRIFHDHQIAKAFRRAAKEVVKAHKITDDELSRLSGCGAATILSVLYGSGSPNLVTAVKIARALRLDLNCLKGLAVDDL